MQAARGSGEIPDNLKGAAQDLKEFDRASRSARLAGAARGATRGVTSVGEDLLGLVKRVGARTSIFAIWTAAFQVLSASIGEWITRATIARQCLTILPLRIYDKEFTAGINGHRGAVYGDPIGSLDERIQQIVDWTRTPAGSIAAIFIPFLADLADADINYRTPAVPPILSEEGDRYPGH
jgi:hypothetical protein